MVSTSSALAFIHHFMKNYFNLSAFKDCYQYRYVDFNSVLNDLDLHHKPKPCTCTFVVLCFADLSNKMKRNKHVSVEYQAFSNFLLHSFQYCTSTGMHIK